MLVRPVSLELSRSNDSELTCFLRTAAHGLIAFVAPIPLATLYIPRGEFRP